MRMFQKTPFGRSMIEMLGVFCLLLSGCYWPQYHSHEQEVTLELPKGTTAEYKGKTLEASNINSKADTYKVTTDVKRTWFDKEITIKREGYEPLTIILDSKPTDDKWAKNVIWSSSEDAPLGSLFLPSWTLIDAVLLGTGLIAAPVVAVVNKDPEAIKYGMEFTGAAISFAPLALLKDAANIFIGIPTTILLNPWAEYKHENSYVLEPVDGGAPLIIEVKSKKQKIGSSSDYDE